MDNIKRQKHIIETARKNIQKGSRKKNPKRKTPEERRGRKKKRPKRKRKPAGKNKGAQKKARRPTGAPRRNTNDTPSRSEQQDPHTESKNQKDEQQHNGRKIPPTKRNE